MYLNEKIVFSIVKKGYSYLTSFGILWLFCLFMQILTILPSPPLQPISLMESYTLLLISPKDHPRVADDYKKDSCAKYVQILHEI